MPKSKKKAFTLTELLVVVVIIGVLAAVVLPKFNKVVETRKTTEAEEIMAAVRTEQEYRCALDKPYIGNIAKFSEILPNAQTKHFGYSLETTGMLASSKGKYAYTLKMPSYADGRVCCEGAECNKLNKDYPSCAELEAKPDYKLATQCKAELPTCDNSHTEGEISTQTACGCGTATYTRWTCNGSAWITYQDASSCRNVSQEQSACEASSGVWDDASCSCTRPACDINSESVRQNRAFCEDEEEMGNILGTWNMDTCSCDCPVGYRWKEGYGCDSYCMDIPGNQQKEWDCINFNGEGSPVVEGEWNNRTCTCSCPAGSTLENGMCVVECSREMAQACTDGRGHPNAGSGTWDDNTCTCTCPEGYRLDEFECVPKCRVDDSVKQNCINGSHDMHSVEGTWNDNTCSCSCPAGSRYTYDDHFEMACVVTNCDPDEMSLAYCESDSNFAQSADDIANLRVPGIWNYSTCSCHCLKGSAWHRNMGMCLAYNRNTYDDAADCLGPGGDDCDYYIEQRTWEDMRNQDDFYDQFDGWDGWDGWDDGPDPDFDYEP